MKNTKYNEPQVPESVHQRIQQTMDALPDEKKIIRFPMKKAVIACACVLAMTGAAVAGGIASGTIAWSKSSQNPDYTTLPSAETIEKDTGLSGVSLPEALGGYTFQGGVIVHNQDVDESGNGMAGGSYLSFSADYKKDGDVLNLDVNPAGTETELEAHKLVQNYQGIDLYYKSQTYKFVPADYEMTEEDKQAQADGSCEYSYGSDKVETQELQFVEFVYDGKLYLLRGADTPCTQKELTEKMQIVVDSLLAK